MKVFFVIKDLKMNEETQQALISMLKKDMEVVIFAKKRNRVEVFECEDYAVPVFLFKELDEKIETEGCDCIFCGQNIETRIEKVKKYVFSLHRMGQYDYFEENLRGFDFIFVDKSHKRKNLSYSSMNIKDENSVEVIADVMQFVHEKYLAKGLFPSVRTYEKDSYKEKMVSSKLITSWDMLIRHRIWNNSIFAMERNSLISPLIDWQPLIKEQKDICLNLELTDTECLSDEEEIYEKLLNKAELAKYKYMIQYKELLKNNSFGRDYFYLAAFRLHFHQYLLNTKFIDEDKNIMLIFCRGLIHYMNEDWEKAVYYFELYLQNWKESKDSIRHFRLPLEKKGEVYKKIIDICYNTGDYEKLCTYIVAYVSDPIYKKNPLEKWAKEKVAESDFVF